MRVGLTWEKSHHKEDGTPRFFKIEQFTLSYFPEPRDLVIIKELYLVFLITSGIKSLRIRNRTEMWAEAKWLEEPDREHGKLVDLQMSVCRLH